MKRLLFLVNIFLIVALLIASSAPYVAPQVSYIPQLLGLFYVHLLVGNVFFLLLWLFFKRRYVIYSLIAVLVGLLFVPRFYQWENKEEVEQQEEGFKLLSYNVRNFIPQNKKDLAVNFFKFVNSQNPAIVCFQEYSQSRYLKYGKKLLSANYPFKYSQGEIATFSKFPIVKKQTIDFDGKEYAKGTFSDILVRKDTLRIFNVHLESNRLSSDNKEDIASFLHKKGRNFKRLVGVYSKLKRASLHRSKQVKKLLKLIKKSPYPVILCGDFNDIPLSYSYQQIKNQLNDSFTEGGSGTGRSFSEGVINVRIDYIFSSLKMYKHHVCNVNYSDHKPIIVRFQEAESLE